MMLVTIILSVGQAVTIGVLLWHRRSIGVDSGRGSSDRSVRVDGRGVACLPYRFDGTPDVQVVG